MAIIPEALQPEVKTSGASGTLNALIGMMGIVNAVGSIPFGKVLELYEAPHPALIRNSMVLTGLALVVSCFRQHDRNTVNSTTQVGYPQN